MKKPRDQSLTVALISGMGYASTDTGQAGVINTYGGCHMRAILSVVGKDRVGILAEVSGICRQYQANIVDVSQTVLQGFFTMIMLVEMDTGNFLQFVDYIQNFGNENDLKIHAMHEDIFKSMHTV